MALKIFMGDMPELMENILNNLDNEINSLYSCTLVSRHWCEMSIPILWKDPFSLNRSPLFVSQYLSSLNENEKSVLRKKYGINVEFSKSLFNYARFLKVLNICHEKNNLEAKVHQWINLTHFYVELDSDTMMYAVVKPLIKLFIESGATLNKFEFYFTESFIFEPAIFCSLEQNEQFFSQLRHLSADVYLSDFYIESTTALLKVLAKNATKISTLEFYESFSSDDQSQLINALIYFIKSQEQLKKFSFSRHGYLKECYGIIAALESQKNSLKEVIIADCAFSAEFEVLKNCKNLETLRISYCDYMIPLKILDYSKISTLEITGSVDSEQVIRDISLIFEKSGVLLQRLKFYKVDNESFDDEPNEKFEDEPTEKFEDDTLLIEALKSFCPNITHLNLENITLSKQIVELIGNLQKLQLLTLYFRNANPGEEVEIWVTKFVEILPLTLQYLDIHNNSWLEPYMDILLDHCKAPLKKLLIYRLNNEKNTKALIDFCVRIKSLNYLWVQHLYDDFITRVEACVTLVPYEHIVVDF